MCGMMTPVPLNNVPEVNRNSKPSAFVGRVLAQLMTAKPTNKNLTLGGSSGITSPSPQQTPDDVLYTKGQQVTGNPWRGSQGSVVRR